MKRPAFNNYLDRRDFAGLFITELGWNNPTSPVNLPAIEVDGTAYNAVIIAQRNGYRVLTCAVDSIPPASVCRRIDIKLRQYSTEYILIFTQNGGTTHHLWLAPVKKIDKRDLVTTEYASADQAEFIWQKINNLAFGYDEVTTIVDVRDRVQSSFAVNSEKITKSFYDSFTKEHDAFAALIKGIEGTSTIEQDRQWYASVMLNRLMFCYFIQKKGFLNNEDDYLRKRLDKHMSGEQNGTFFRSFYLDFLRSLFEDGLNNPRRSKEFETRFGKIPYLNGGMFDTHKIERDYAGLDIADEAFDRLFAFFDKWNWHLDTRITASGKDINPDVLGYIFEQYINNRAEMGAYYTKEDITEYIGRNCILPFLFDATKNATSDSGAYFAPDGFVWSVLRNSGDRYIFDAVKHGFNDFDQIPETIARGIITEEMHNEYSETPVGDLPDSHVPLAELRKDWNTRTPERWGLPTEIWRETIERLQRCGSILDKIRGGEITSINDFITYNLDIRQFAQDLLAEADRHFVRWFYKALQNVTILDPTCGSGAFLFAALNILEPLYEICIDRMQDFNRQNPNYFKDELGEISHKYRSNIQYFIYKSIILRNLYGVDIMVEATEIAKLRLFLKMVAVVDVDRRAENMGLDPLPDIDFNIRCGNTLVGYANREQLDKDLSDNQGSFEIMLANDEFKAQIEEEMEIVKDTYNLFRDIQLNHGDDMVAFKQAKYNLRERLTALNYQLNQRRWKATRSEIPFEEWLATHQPFNWLAEFYQIIQGNGGFDVIIGNPPYVEYNDKKFAYRLSQYKTIKCCNLHAFVAERSLIILQSAGSLGLIVPLPAITTPRMSSLQSLLKNPTIHHSLWISSFDERPSGLFEGVDQRLIIEIIHKAQPLQLFSTHINRWRSENRNLLFKRLQYNHIENNTSKYANQILKLSSPIENHILDKFYHYKPLSNNKLPKANIDNAINYRSAGGRYWKVFLDVPFGTGNQSEKRASFQNISPQCVLASLSSDVFWWYYSSHFDMFNLGDYQIFGFNLLPLNKDAESHLSMLGTRYVTSVFENAIERSVYTKNGKITQKEFYIRKSKPIIDEIDKVLAKHYGFSDEELDFIINYDIKYRMGDELSDD